MVCVSCIPSQGTKIPHATRHGKQKRVKTQLTEWEGIFTSNVPYKGLIFRIYKELLQLNNQQNKDTTKEWASRTSPLSPQKRMGK